jgi:hypothetical protein
MDAALHVLVLASQIARCQVLVGYSAGRAFREATGTSST